MPRLHILQHVPFEGPGCIPDWAQSHGIQLTTVALYDGEPVPAIHSVEGLVLMGGPMSVNDEDQHPFLAAEKELIRGLHALGIPILGICLGSQLIAAALGGRVYATGKQEIGWWPVQLVGDLAAAPPALQRLPDRSTVFHWHGDTFDLPAGAINWLKSNACTHQLFSVGKRTIGVQFHPETNPDVVESMLTHAAADLALPGAVQSAKEIRAQIPRYGHQQWFRWLLDGLFIGTGDE